jgi:hypothetical protein
MTPDDHAATRPVIWARLLLLLPFIAMLWVPSYNSVEPSVAGVPFFYWYQLAWIIVGGILVAIVYRLEH